MPDLYRLIYVPTYFRLTRRPVSYPRITSNSKCDKAEFEDWLAEIIWDNTGKTRKTERCQWQTCLSPPNPTCVPLQGLEGHWNYKERHAASFDGALITNRWVVGHDEVGGWGGDDDSQHSHSPSPLHPPRWIHFTFYRCSDVALCTDEWETPLGYLAWWRSCTPGTATRETTGVTHIKRDGLLLSRPKRSWEERDEGENFAISSHSYCHSSVAPLVTA